MPKIKYTKELLEPIVKSSISYKEVIDKLGLSFSNGTHALIYKLILKHELDSNHFINSKNKRKTYSDKEMFKNDSQATRASVKVRIIKEKLIPYICECCGQDENWQGKIMPLILDHKDGINNNNELSNLRFLCSNCDSIQDTYKGKNANKSFKERVKRNKIEYSNKIFENKIIKEQQKLNFINQIKNSDIDFTKHGYLIEVGKLLNWTPQWSQKFISKNIPELYKNCKKHIKN